MRGYWTRTAIGLSLIFSASAVQADYLVTRSNGSVVAREFPRGSRIDAEQEVILQNGESITILTRAGTRNFRGPGRYSLQSLPSLIGNRFWLAARQTQQPRVAVLRMEIMPPPPDILRPFQHLWEIDPDETGRICYLSEEILRTPFSGISMPGVEEVVFTRLSDGEQRRFRFDPDIGSLRNDDGWLEGWPVGLAIEPGARFRINAEPAESHPAFPVEIEFIALEIDPYDGINPSLERIAFVRQVVERLEQVGEELSASGCEGQRQSTEMQIRRYQRELADADQIPGEP